MSKLKKPVSYETTFGVYEVHELLGEGGAGCVYGGVGIDGTAIALKLLTKASTDKRGRFKNEIAFLLRNQHKNIVTVLDHGIQRGKGKLDGPFYVMRRYDGSLRDLMQSGIAPDQVLPLFSQILDGVEAAHFQGAVHRDLKPENILYERSTNTLAIADFGIASFTEDQLVTLVETTPAQRLANFQYAAPEQRSKGKRVTAACDIYALGLILNEMFTGDVPHGTAPRVIGDVVRELSFLDAIVAMMLRQNPTERPATIADLKGAIQRYQSEAVTVQRLSKLDGTVIKAGEIDEPLALEPPKLIGFDWENGVLTLVLDRAVNHAWVTALQQMPAGHLMGYPPGVFAFRGDKATVNAREHSVQPIINNFKGWLPQASRFLKQSLEEAAVRREEKRREELRRHREAEEQRLRVLRNIKL